MSASRLFYYASSRTENALVRENHFRMLLDESQKPTATSETLYYLALCYEGGHGTPVSPQKAVPLFKRVTKTLYKADGSYQIDLQTPDYVIQACRKMAGYHEAGLYVEQNITATCDYLAAAVSSANPETATNITKQIAALIKKYPQHRAPLVAYGRSCEYGRGVIKDREIAKGYYKRAAALPGSLSFPMNFLSRMATEENNYEEACQWSMQAAKENSNIGLVNLTALTADYAPANLLVAECYEKGYANLKQPDYPAAIKYYEKAAEKNDVVMVKLARFYLEGREGVEKDLRKAHQWLVKAILLNTKNAEGSLAAFQLLETMVNENPDYAWAIHNLGFCHSEGIVVAKDKRKAIPFYERSAQLGNAASMHNLASIHSETDRAKEIEWLFKALSTPDAKFTRKKREFCMQRLELLHAHYEVAVCAIQGYGKPSYSADYHLKRAQEKNDERAFYLLGVQAEEGAQLDTAIRHYAEVFLVPKPRANVSEAALSALERIVTNHPEDCFSEWRSKNLLAAYEKSPTLVNLQKQAGFHSAKMKKQQLKLSTPLSLSLLMGDIKAIRKSCAALSATVLKTLQQQRQALLSQAEQGELARINRLIEISHQCNDMSIYSYASLKQTASTLASDPSFEAQHLREIVEQEFKIHHFIAALKANLQHCKKRIEIHPWKVRSFGRWVDGKPSAIKKMGLLLENIDKAQDDDVLAICEKVQQALHERDADSNSRHEDTKAFYATMEGYFKKIDFYQIVGHKPLVEAPTFVVAPVQPAAPYEAPPAYVAPARPFVPAVPQELTPPLLIDVPTPSYMMPSPAVATVMSQPVANLIQMEPIEPASLVPPKPALPVAPAPVLSAPVASAAPAVKAKPVAPTTKKAPVAAEPSTSFFGSIGSYIGSFFSREKKKPALAFKAPAMEMRSFMPAQPTVQFAEEAQAAPALTPPPPPAPVVKVAPPSVKASAPVSRQSVFKAPAVKPAAVIDRTVEEPEELSPPRLPDVAVAEPKERRQMLPG